MKRVIFVLLASMSVAMAKNVVNVPLMIEPQQHVNDAVKDIMDEVTKEREKLGTQGSLSLSNNLAALFKGISQDVIPEIKALQNDMSPTEARNIDVTTQSKIEKAIQSICKKNTVLEQQESRIEMMANRYHQIRLDEILGETREVETSYDTIFYGDKLKNPINDESASIADILNEVLSEMWRLSAQENEHFFAQITTNVQAGYCPGGKRVKRQARNYCPGEAQPPKDEQKRINKWIDKMNFNQWGDCKGTMYTGGSASFDERTGCYHTQYSILIKKYPDKPWNQPENTWTAWKTTWGTNHRTCN
ncbi:hypothetical protein JW872_02930 [Candidatus Babeliales bacterium]|nr:hypothetical protein [Candidatus Babeliales bacterium]